MRTRRSAVFAALAVLPALVAAQEQSRDDEMAPDEVVVVGHTVSANSARVQVEQEILVDIAAAMKNLPGADVNRNGLLTGIAQYRGMFGDRVAVDIDQLGVISGGPNAMDAPLSYMSPMMTEELVVSRGIASVSSAPETIGGHISTRTARGDFGAAEFDFSGTLGTRFASNGNVSTSVARLTLADENHRISAVGEADSGDDIITPEGEIRPSGLRRDRYDLSYAYAGGDTEFLVYAGKLETGHTGTPALPMDILVIDTDLVGTRVAFAAGAGLVVEGRFGYNSVDHEMDNHSLRQAPAAARHRLTAANGSGSKFYLSVAWDRGESAFLVGVDGASARHDAVITNPNNAMFQIDNFASVRRDLVGLFGEWRLAVGDNEVEAGLRYNYVDANAGQVGATGLMGTMGERVDLLAAEFNAARRRLSWRSLDAVLKYRRLVSDAIGWNVELGSKSRAPSYQELYLWLPMQSTGGLADGRTYIGNLGLKEERSREVVVGLSAASGRFRASPQIFYRRINDYIQGVPAADTVATMVSTMMSGAAPLQFANVDAEIWGLDAAWRYDLSETWYLDGALTAVRGKRRDRRDHLYRLSPINASIGLTYSADRWTFRSELIAYAEQDRVSAFNGETETPGYWLVNLGADWTPLPSLRVEARLNNVLDESYQDHVTGINRAAGSAIPVGERLFGAERTVSAGLIYSF